MPFNNSNNPKYSQWIPYSSPFRASYGVSFVSLIPQKSQCLRTLSCYNRACYNDPDSKVHEAYMGPTWGRQDPGEPHVGPMNLAIRGGLTVWLLPVLCLCYSYPLISSMKHFKFIQSPTHLITYIIHSALQALSCNFIKGFPVCCFVMKGIMFHWCRNVIQGPLEDKLAPLVLSSGHG